MADGGTPKPTGRRVRGYISDLVELSVERTLWTAVVYHEDYRPDAALKAASEGVHGFAIAPSEGVAPLVLSGPGVLGFATGEVRCTRELMGAASEGVGWAAAVDWAIGAMQALAAAAEMGLPHHSSLDPHRILIGYDGVVQLIGCGIPRLDLVDFLDDATLVPITESLRFTAPESLEGTAEDASTDLFILGLILVELATGSPLYNASDAKELLALAADGEASSLLTDRAVPDAVSSWLSLMLQPWPDDRHPDIHTALKAARVGRADLQGPSLEAAMEAHAEVASSVEIDLPRGWALPEASILEVPSDPGRFEEERASRCADAEALLPPLEIALKAVDKALAKLVKPSNWSNTAEASARRDEARSHGDRAREAARTARRLLAEMRDAPDASSLSALAETFEEAVAMARGGAEEGERTAVSALELREVGLAAQAANEKQALQKAAHERRSAEAKKSLATWVEEAREAVASLPDLPPLEHVEHADVVAANEALVRVRNDAQSSCSALEDLVLEPEDDPDEVLDAARMHLDVTREKAVEAQRALKALVDADEAVSKAAEQAAEQAQQARERFEEEFAATGDRVRAAFERVNEAVEGAAERAKGFEVPVEDSLGALQQRLEVLRSRLDNLEAMGASDEVELTLEALEDRVHTGRAEADFADADLADLPMLLADFDAALAVAQADKQRWDEQRQERLRRLMVPLQQLREAQGDLAAANGFVLPADIEPELLQRGFEALTQALDLANPLAKAAAEVAFEPDEGMPDEDALQVLEGQGVLVRDAAEQVRNALGALQATIAEHRNAQLEAEETRRAWVKRGEAIQQQLNMLLVEHVPPALTGDVAIDDRLAPDRSVLLKTLQGFPDAPQVDLENDPAGALASLETTLAAASQAEAARLEATALYEERSQAVTALVVALVETCQRAEAAADEAASIAAQAIELRVDLGGEWPGLVDESEAVAAQIEALQALAKTASTAAETTASAQSTEAAESSAKEATKALAASKKRFKSVSAKAARLRKRLQVARAERAAEDETARQAAVGTARSLLGSIQQIQQELDAALQQAGERIEGSPSATARSAWEQAESIVDAAQQEIARLEELQQRVEKATERREADDALAALQAGLQPAQDAVQRAGTLVAGAADLADVETQANVALHESLHLESAELGEQLRAIHEAIEHSQNLQETPGVPDLVTKLQEQLVFAQEAREAVSKGIVAVNDAGEQSVRDELGSEVRSQIARLGACRNTARALRDRVDAFVAEAAEQDAVLRASCRSEAEQLLGEAREELEATRALAEALAPVRANPDLDVVVAEADLQLGTCESVLADLASLHLQIQQADSGVAAATILQQANDTRASMPGVCQAHDEAIQRAVAALDAVHSAEAELREARVREHVQAIERVRTAQQEVRSSLDAFEHEWNEVRQELDGLDLEPELEGVRHEVARLELFLEGLPGEVGPEGLEIATEIAAGSNGVRKRVALGIEAMRAQLEQTRSAAVALAGIRDAARSVRQRYDGLESQLKDASDNLDRAIEHAPLAAASLGYQDALEQLEELDTTLLDAKTSLDDLNAASDAEEARALLEVTEASLDIASSLFEFALPVVEDAIRQANAEAAEKRALQERRKHALALLEQAQRDLPDVASRAGWVDEAMASVEGLQDAAFRDELTAAEQKLHQAFEDWSETRSFLAAEVDVTELEALEQGAQRCEALRTTLDHQEQQIVAHAQAVTQASDDLRILLREQQARVDSATTSVQAKRKALQVTQQELADRVRDAREVAAGWSEPAVVLALEALVAHGKSIADLQIDALPASADPAAFEALDEGADALLEAARDPKMELLEDALNTTIQEAKREAADRAERVAELRTELDGRHAAILKAVADADQQLQEAATRSEPWPLETLEPMEALGIVVGVFLQAEIPERPEEPDPPTEARIEQLQGVVQALKQLDATLQEVVLAPAVRAVLDAVEAAEQAALDEREAIVAAHDRIAAAVIALKARQTAAEERVQNHAELLAMPELADVAEAFRSAVEQLMGVTIDAAQPPERGQAEAVALAAEAASRTPIPVEELADALETAAEKAHLERAEIHARITTASDAVAERLAHARSLLIAVADHGSSPRLDASVRALEEAVDQIEQASVHHPQDVDVETLRIAAEEAEFVVQAALAVDLEGLLEEVNAAVAKDAAEAADAEAERAGTQEQAVAAVDAALLQLSMEVEARRDGVENFPSDPRAAPHRSRARDALEGAGAIMLRLEALQGRLQVPLTMVEAVSATFDAESQADTAMQLLDDVDAAVSAGLMEIEKLDRVSASVPKLLSRIQDVGDSLERTVADLPDPEGEDAVAVAAELVDDTERLHALRAEAAQCAVQLERASTAFAAETEQKRLVQIEQELLALARQVRTRASSLRQAVEAQRSREDARRAESLADGVRQVELARNRARLAVSAIGAVLSRASDRCKGLDDPELEVLLTKIATSNEAALEAVDQTRKTEHADEATAAADRAEQALKNAQQALGLLESAVEAVQAAQQQKEQALSEERLAGRDEQVVALRKRLDGYAAVLAQVAEGAAVELPNSELEGVRQKSLQIHAAASEAVRVASERIDLLMNAKAEDVQDFLQDALRSADATHAKVAELRSAATELAAANEAAKQLGADLQLEEARGRAWEACTQIQRLTKDLTIARNALPELPTPPPPEFREAADQLADVERRLWRAGQRADEAKERAGASDDLEVAERAAKAAETAVGSIRRWEKEIDGALDKLSQLLKGPGYTDVGPAKNKRMERLRRGRNQATADDAQQRLRRSRDSRPPFAETSASAGGESATERLLQRLRQGRAQGETGRERLRRLRQQRKEKRQEPTPDAYPSVAEFEDERATVLAQPEADAPTAPDPVEPPPAPIPIDEGRTQVFTREQLHGDVEDDAATQMFTREMLDHIVGDDLDETQTSAAPNSWAEEDGSTKYSTLSPNSLRDRKKKDPR